MEATEQGASLDEFKAQIDALAAASTPPARERQLLGLGRLMMIVGVLLTLVSWVLAGSQSAGDLALDNLEQNELIILAITGLSLAVAGAAVYLRHSLTGFLRLWLLRQVVENKANLQAMEKMLDR